MADENGYALYGGQPTKILPLAASEAGTYVAPEGCAYSPVTVSGKQPDLQSKTVDATENGTRTVQPDAGKDGLSSVTVNVNVPSYFDVLTAPYPANDGTFVLVATGADNASAVGVCVVANGMITDSYGDGTFNTEGTQEAPTLTWTPTITATDTVCRYARGGATT